MFHMGLKIDKKHSQTLQQNFNIEQKKILLRKINWFNN